MTDTPPGPTPVLYREQEIGPAHGNTYPLSLPGGNDEPANYPYTKSYEQCAESKIVMNTKILTHNNASMTVLILILMDTVCLEVLIPHLKAHATHLFPHIHTILHIF